MLGLVASSSTSPPLVPDGGAGVGAGADPAPAVRVVELPSLLEKKPEEWIPGNYEPFRRRIEEFERWLGEQPERTVAIVGHSQFFKAMLDLDYKFGNCEVWEMTFDAKAAAAAAARGSSDAERKGEGEDAALRGGWEGLRNVYRCDV
uniref:Phosphoglycerate mutase n=1 Tax=Trieres chinensis TaxID=1514140 RepID=A0A7S2EJQ4_TRICV|mmetsp:Transcript_27273/g.55815  ORF Transcript_27273/g.55815 Transcript_27273/m.55815 type:complete len:147 (+) Transcript_27273:374-814(+)